MSRLTVLILLVLVAGLGYLAYRQAQDEAHIASELEIQLFEGLDPNRVTGVRIDNLERAAQLAFERDPKGGWIMTDPRRMRAEGGILDLLVQQAVARRGTPVGDSENDPKKLGLDPPRFVLELITDTGQRQRIDVGAVDLDRNRIHVRARGRILRAVRDFETLLDIMPEEYQSHAATTIEVRDVIELRRRGTVQQLGEPAPADVTLDALQEEGLWRTTAPVNGLLDPLAIGILLHSSAGLRFDHYVETGGEPLSVLGLDPPEMMFELETVRGEVVKLLFGRTGHRPARWWNGVRAGDDHVWAIPEDLALALAVGVVDLLDHRLHRFPQNAIDGIELSTAARELKLEKSVTGWTVAEARAGSRVFAPPLAADAKKVADLLIALDRHEIRTFVMGSELDPGEARGAIHVRAQGAVAGGAFGGAHAGGGVRFRRDGDSVVGVVDDALLELVRTPPQALWSTSIVEIVEVEAQALALKRADQEIVFARDRRGAWVRTGQDTEARELHRVLDPLLFLRASKHLESRGETLADPIEVSWTLAAGKVSLVVGVLVEADGKRVVVADYEGRRSVLQRQDLHAMLAELFAERR